MSEKPDTDDQDKTIPNSGSIEIEKTTLNDNNSANVPVGWAIGKDRPYLISTPSTDFLKSTKFTRKDKIFFHILLVLSVGIRFYKLWNPPSVVFDEVHFGGFSRKYVIGRWFMDVHPPLAKLLFALVAFVGRFDGEFEFKDIGDEYIGQNVPYILMRSWPCFLGVLVVLLSYLTLKSSGCRSEIAFLGSFWVMIDNALITQSRFILLDSPLLFFIALTIFGFKRFQIQTPFTKPWYRYLCLTGMGLGLSASSKWVGFFTVSWVGIHTLIQLWFLLGDLSIPIKDLSKHFRTRVFFLISLPFIFYMGFFAIHFIAACNTGDDASFMSPEFQTTLKHNPIPKSIPGLVTAGSTISLRHYNTRGGYLHSHEHNYQTGSQQQQITLYGHLDENNDFKIEPVDIKEGDNKTLTGLNGTILSLLGNRDKIRLRHVITGKRLHVSPDFKPPISELDYQHEVSGFLNDDNEEIGPEDDWEILINYDYTKNQEAKDNLIALETKFQLYNSKAHCYLFSHPVSLPEWGFGQQEVTCIDQPTVANSIWIIEENKNPNAPPTRHVSYKRPGFFAKFIEVNKVMWVVNKGLVESHNWDSKPESWPVLARGINFWGKTGGHIYLIGNAPIWWATTFFIFSYLAYRSLKVLRTKSLGLLPDYADKAKALYQDEVGSYLLGWFLHYFPSFLMARQLFLHHYLASLYFAILAMAQTFEFITSKHKKIGYGSMIILTCFGIQFFIKYSPLIYGTPWTQKECLASIPSFTDWDFDCNMYSN